MSATAPRTHTAIEAKSPGRLGSAASSGAQEPPNKRAATAPRAHTAIEAKSPGRLGSAASSGAQEPPNKRAVTAPREYPAQFTRLQWWLYAKLSEAKLRGCSCERFLEGCSFKGNL